MAKQQYIVYLYKIAENLYKNGAFQLNMELFPGGVIIDDVSKMAATFSMTDGFCVKQVIDTSNVSRKDMIYYKIYPMTNYNIMVSDSAKSAYYMINSHTLKGGRITAKNGLNMYYRISFEEVHWLEEAGGCDPYGDNYRFKTFADCVAQEHEEIFNPILGCNVPWLSSPANPGNCKGSIQLDDDAKANFVSKMKNLWHEYKYTGQAHSDYCQPPCVELFAEAELIRKAENEKDAKVSLNFNRKVKVTRYRRAYGPFELIVDIGSSLGLWIGLSALGIVDLMLKVCSILKQRLHFN